MDLFDSLDKIAPILVFLFWIIISIFSQSKKTKQKRSIGTGSSTSTMPQYRKTAPTTTTSSYGKSETKQSHNPTFDELKKKLETIFNESLPVDQDEESADEEKELQYETTIAPPAPMTVKPETTSGEETRPVQLKFEKKKWYSNEVSNVYDQTETAVSGQTAPGIDLSIDKIREGFILSEIIAPPVALRDDRC